MRLLAFVLVAALISGQATSPAVADAARAIARGDYATAVGILKPLAEDSPAPDPSAQFYLASLYESGHGVQPDLMHACSLYLNASRSENPHSRQALVLAKTIRDRLGPMAGRLCTPGVWRALPSTTFTLGPDHWVRFDETGTTVSYQGMEHRTAGRSAGAGWMFPPMRHTALDVVAPAAGRRHFFELFVWMPDESRGQTAWTLAWGLTEVSGPDLTTVTGDFNLLTVVAAHPPTPFDPSTVVQVRLNAKGEAEWAVVSGTNQRSAVITPKAVR